VSAGLSLVVTGAENPDLLPSLRDLLTPREFQIAGYVRDALENREIAKILGVSVGAIKIRLRNAFDRSGCDNRVQLAVRYQREEMQGRYER
jgi:DNA-binding NarL/FixJ family response regulator